MESEQTTNFDHPALPTHQTSENGESEWLLGRGTRFVAVAVCRLMTAHRCSCTSGSFRTEHPRRPIAVARRGLAHVSVRLLPARLSVSSPVGQLQVVASTRQITELFEAFQGGAEVAPLAHASAVPDLSSVRALHWPPRPRCLRSRKTRLLMRTSPRRVNAGQ